MLNKLAPQMSLPYNASSMRGPLRGPGGGMDDKIPAMIMMAEGGPVEPALLSPGEYVIDAQTVAMLGDGSNDRGAEILDLLVEEIRRVKTGKTEQPKPLKSLLSQIVMDDELEESDEDEEDED